MTEESMLNDSLREIVVGSVSGAIGKVIEYPFDTVKVRLQYSQTLPEPLFTSTWDCIAKTYHNEGVFKGFWKGLLSPMMGASMEVSSLFFSYKMAQDLINLYQGNKINTELPFGYRLACGCASGMVTSFILTPVELVKCQLQVDNLKSQKTARTPLGHVISQIRTQYGLRGFWKGQSSTLVREAGGTAAWFGCYEYTLECFRGDKGPDYNYKTHELLIAGAMAGVGYNASLFPADTVKNVLQTSEHHKSVSSAIKAVHSARGLRGFYSGLGITLVKTIPASAAMFYSYEHLKRMWN
ncbi:hypothetical protein OGAPHI_000508 [Ogataea philodendri]|uniref:Uncharacterized protein n=1 Tax=Ogataea philodendri TaxID=1378263 RepID=A0A9P8TAF4_9ASCO|nr:uncharacterized protein OGAPHI_000508 [Ogataea philodendri]KAH3671285.1 hypothetical protein OGAPHI_000508 [Ogataea philodendri]